MIDDEMLIEIKDVIDMWESSISNSSVYGEVMEAFTDKNIKQLFQNTTANLNDIKKIYDIVSLYEKYKKNAQYLEQHYASSRVSKLLEMLDEGSVLENCNDISVVQKEQDEIKEKLARLGFNSVGVVPKKSTQENNRYNEIVSIAVGNAYLGERAIIGLRRNGTVIVTKNTRYNTYPYNVQGWTNVKSIHVCEDSIIGLRRDGSIVAEGRDSWVLDVRTWVNIASIYVYGGCVVGLKRDGTVVVEIGRSYSCLVRCPRRPEFWRNVTNIHFFFNGIVVGLRRDGKVAIADRLEDYLINWDDVVDICGVDYGATSTYIVGLRKDGTAVISGTNPYVNTYGIPFDVRGWTNVKTIHSTFWGIFGLRRDGTVLATGTHPELYNKVRNWRNISSIYFIGGIIGVRGDGTVVSVGLRPHLECEINKWTNIASIYAHKDGVIGLRRDGTIVAAGADAVLQKVRNWTSIASIHIFDSEIVGLRRDGTVVTNTSHNVEDWGK